MQIGEVVNGSHDIHLDDVPACFEESTHKAIRSRSLIRWRFKHGSSSLLLGERGSNVTEVTVRGGNALPVKVPLSPGALLDNRREVAVNDGLFMVVVGNPATIMF